MLGNAFSKIWPCFIQPLTLKVYHSNYQFEWIFDRHTVLYVLGNDRVENDQPPEAANVPCDSVSFLEYGKDEIQEIGSTIYAPKK